MPSIGIGIRIGGNGSEWSPSGDSVLLASKIDTAAILANYFMLNYYTREWEDSLLYAKSEDVITENKFVDNIFTYRIKRPTQVILNNIDNSTHYSKYIALGIDVPIKDINYIEVEGIFNFGKGYIGAGYTPQLKSFDIKLGGVILKFKK